MLAGVDNQKINAKENSLFLNSLKEFDSTLANTSLLQDQDSKIQRTRHILGDTVSNLSEPQLESDLTKFDYLLNSWLDEFEKNIFNGKTLQELIALNENV